MNHAFLIGAYQNPEYLKSLINSLDSSRSDIYVHINRLNVSEFESLILSYAGKKNVHFYYDISVKWGGVSLLETMKLLLNEARKNPENAFFHFLTGQDALVKPLNELFSFFEKNKEKNFIHAHNSLEQLNNKELYNDFFYDRYRLFHFYDNLDYRSHGVQYYLGRALTKFLKHIGIRKKIPFKTLYRCSSWFSINVAAVDEMLLFLNNPKKFNMLRHTFAPDEMFIASVLLNSDCPERFNIVNDSLRFLKFPPSGNGSPKILVETDFDEIVNSNAFFARKIDPKKSSKLIEKLNECIHSET